MIRELDGEIDMLYSDDDIDIIEKTITATEELLRAFCVENIPNFIKKGAVQSKLEYNEGEIINNISVKYNGKNLEDTEYSVYELAISKYLSESNQDIGWEEDED